MPEATLEDAIALAAALHYGQRDKAGEAYILHPLRLMMAVEGDVARMVAVLHDVVEDSEFDLEDLEERGYPAAVIEAVDHLTRRDGEPYEDFVERVAQHPLATTVKLADLEDNMDMRRLPWLEPAATERLERYHRAWMRLRSVQGDRTEG